MKEILLLVLVLLLVLLGCKKLRKTIIIPQNKIQDAVNKKFPMDINKVILRLHLSNPKVYFVDDKIGIKIEYRGRIVGKVITGIIDVTSSFYYVNGLFYLKDFNLVDITHKDKTINNMAKIKGVIQKLLNNGFDKYPIYKLDTKDIKQKLAKAMLKSVSVQNNNLSVTIGL